MKTTYPDVPALGAMQAEDLATPEAVEEPKPALPLALQKEAIYRKAAMDIPLTMDEIAVIADEDRDEYAYNVRRLATVIKHQKLAGTAAERDAARHALSDAATKLASESADIQKQLDDLQYRKSRLHLAVRDAQAVVDRHDHAVRRLRSSVPKHVKEFEQAQQSIFKLQPQFSRMRFLEGYVRHLQQVIRIDVSTHDGKELAKNHAEEIKRNALTDTTVSTPVPRPTQEYHVLTDEDAQREACGIKRTITLNVAAWAKYIEKLQRELPALEAELAKLQDEYAAGIAEIETSLDHYLT